MSTITFGGLASGLDTDSIIEALMEIESAPLETMESDISYYEAETEAFSELNDLLEDFLDVLEDMDTVKELSTNSATSSNESLLTASASSSAIQGSYHIEVVSLAEAQKDVVDNGISDTDTTTLSGSLTIGETTIDYSDVTLEDLVDMINDSDSGVRAAIINDGSENGYRLSLTGEEAGVTTEISGTGDIEIDTATNGHTYEASQAHIIVDNVDIYSTSNTIDDAIPGVTLDLVDADPDESFTLTVETDTDSIEDMLENFVEAYNDIIDWIDDQSDSDWGSDATIRTMKNKMQSFLTTQTSGSSTYNCLTMLGFETDYETGKISIDSSTLQDALEDDLDGVLEFLSGTNTSDGITDLMGDYFDSITDRENGIYAARSDSNDATISRLNDRIDRLEARLEKREEFYREQYTALEEMMSELNAQLSYIEAIGS